MRNSEEFMHLHLSTHADIISYFPGGIVWDMVLCGRFPGLVDYLPILPPEGDRRLKVKKYWSSVALKGPDGTLQKSWDLEKAL